MAYAIKALLSHYDAAFEKKTGHRYPFSRPKDPALAKRLLALYTLEELVAWIDWFFAMHDAFIEQSGYGFGVFCACLPKVIASKAKAKSRPALAPDEQAHVAAVSRQMTERNREAVKELADEYYRTHPWAMKPGR